MLEFFLLLPRLLFEDQQGFCRMLRLLLQELVQRVFRVRGVPNRRVSNSLFLCQKVRLYLLWKCMLVRYKLGVGTSDFQGIQLGCSFCFSDGGGNSLFLMVDLFSTVLLL